MEKLLILSVLLVCFCNSSKLPGPLVYVVTPSPPPPGSGARAAPFYYHNWMRRVDSPRNVTTTPKTPDLIFAEFESGDKVKSIRKLLENEKIEPKTTTSSTSRPIYVTQESNEERRESAPKKKDDDARPVDMTDYFALYNNMYNPDSKDLAPVYMPSTPSTTTTLIPRSSPTSPSPGSSVENIWHIIDSQKYDQYPGRWEEEPVANEEDKDARSESKPEPENNSGSKDPGQEEIDDNFALPGFATNLGNGAENESRAIRTEPNMRFPHIHLKPFQMKTQKIQPVNSISSSKKGNNMYTSLDNFQDVKNPVRGEAQDVVPMRQPIDRYNPAQPYLPDYGTKSKQSSPSAPSNSVANLVPPPPPPPPSISDGNFPAPASYEPFPPYAPTGPPATPPPPPAPTPSIMYQPPVDTSDDSWQDAPPSDSDGPPVDLGYRYKAPSPPVQAFIPTLPPLTQPGYSYAKPPMSKPFGGYSYKPPIDDSPDVIDDKPDFQGYHSSKPEPAPAQDHPPAGYGHDAPPYGHDYPELIYDKPHYHHHHPTTTTTETPRVNRYSYYYLGKKLYYLPLYFSVYFIVYVGALIIKAVLRHKIVYPNSWRPNDQTASFFSKRSVDSLDLSNENLHEITGKVTHAIAVAGEKYFTQKKKE